MLLLSISCVVVSAQCIWREINGPFKDFLNENGNSALDYLIDGVHWYQLKIRLNGTYYFVPLTIASERKFFALRETVVYKWFFTLPVQNIKNTGRKSNDEMIALYGDPGNIFGLNRKSCMSIILENGTFFSNIHRVQSNEYYRGREVMTIFMVILIKRNIKIERIVMLDTSSKYCHINLWNPPIKIPQSIFMGFLGRFDFYREYGFYVTPCSAPCVAQQREFDDSAMKLSKLSVNKVIEVAMDDRVSQRAAVRPLFDDLMGIHNTNKTVLISQYLKPLTDEWDRLCEKYVQIIEALQQIPSIKRQYFDRLKTNSFTLVWMPSEMKALEQRLKKVQDA